MAKKLVSLLLAVALVLSLAACGPTSTTAATAAVTEASAVGSYHSFYADQEPVYVPAFTLGGTTETTGAGGYLLRQRAEFSSGKGHHRPDPEAAEGHAPLCQRRGLHRHHPKRRHPGMPERAAVETLLAANL